MLPHMPHMRFVMWGSQRTAESRRKPSMCVLVPHMPHMPHLFSRDFVHFASAINDRGLSPKLG